MNKAWDVFGSIIAWILSVALVILLIVTPILFSALSLMDTKTITKVVSELFTTEQTPSQPKEEPRLEGGIRAVTLSGVTKTADSAENVAKGVLSDLFGESLTPEQINQILSSDAAKELIDAYTEDLTDALTGNDGQMNFTEDKIKAVVDEHIDDIVDVVRKVDPKFADMTDEEIKAEILKVICEKSEKLEVLFETYDGEYILGHTPEFAIFEFENDKLVSEKIISTGENGHGALAGILAIENVDVVICGGIGGGAVNALANAGIQVVGGAEGNVKETALAFVAGTLQVRANFHCGHHHHGEGHSCGNHGCGSGKCH